MIGFCKAMSLDNDCFFFLTGSTCNRKCKSIFNVLTFLKSYLKPLIYFGLNQFHLNLTTKENFTLTSVKFFTQWENHFDSPQPVG